MKKFKIFISGLFVILLFHSCERTGLPINIPEPNDILKKYFKFNSGTTWVYNLEGTNDTSIDYVNNDKGIYDICQIISQEKPFKFGFESNTGNIMCIRFSDEWNSQGHCVLVESDTFIYKPRIFNQNSDSSGILDSVVLNGTKYYHVIKSIDKSMTYFKEYWFAPNIGIIKKITHNHGGVVKIFTLRRFKKT